jgi:hypothetical protein
MMLMQIAEKPMIAEIEEMISVFAESRDGDLAGADRRGTRIGAFAPPWIDCGKIPALRVPSTFQLMHGCETPRLSQKLQKQCVDGMIG